MKRVLFTTIILTVFLLAFPFNPIQTAKVASLPSVYSWFKQGESAGGAYGSALSCAGDVNNDGYDDIIIGSYLDESGYLDEGLAFTHLGSDTGISQYASWTNGPNQDSAFYGASVAFVGDINNDGYGDVIVGSPNFMDADSLRKGKVSLYLGEATTLSPFVSWSYISDQADCDFGFSAAAAGDVNGDGYADLMIGAPNYDMTYTDEGRVFIFFGSDSGFSNLPDWTSNGGTANANFGYAVSSAGDMNNDGYDDIIIGSPDYVEGDSLGGKISIYEGNNAGVSPFANESFKTFQTTSRLGCSVASAGDLNDDGFDDAICGAENYSYGSTGEGAVFVLYGWSSGTIYLGLLEVDKADVSFGSSVSSAGDVNGDGYDDILVGAKNYTNSQNEEGAAFVFLGSSSFINGNSPSWSYFSGSENSHFGSAVASAGDVNNDGYPDIIVGAPDYNGYGAVFGFYGEPEPTGLKISASAEKQTNSIRVLSDAIILVCSESSSEMEIFDSAGRCVLSQSNLNAGVNKIKSDALEAGIYFIKLTDSKSSLTKKAVLIK